MIRIYTPEAWKGIFRGEPELFINDEGYMFTKDPELTYRFDSCGKIDFPNGRIYGPDYNSLWPTPIAEFHKTNYGVTVVNEFGGSLFASPILYIKDDQIYSPDQYCKIFGSTPKGYIHRDPVPELEPELEPEPEYSRPAPSGGRDFERYPLTEAEKREGRIVMIVIAVLVALLVAWILGTEMSLIVLGLAALCGINIFISLKIKNKYREARDKYRYHHRKR